MVFHDTRSPGACCCKADCTMIKLSQFVPNLCLAALSHRREKKTVQPFVDTYFKSWLLGEGGRTIKQSSCHVSRGIQTPDGAPGAGVDPGLTVKKGSRQSRPGQTTRAAFQTFKQQQLGDYNHTQSHPYAGLTSSSINPVVL